MTDPAAPPWWQYARKAVITGASLGLVALSSLVISLTPDSDGGSAITTTEWVRLGIAVLTAVAGTTATFKVPNNYGTAKATPPAADPDADTRMAVARAQLATQLADQQGKGYAQGGPVPPVHQGRHEA